MITHIDETCFEPTGHLKFEKCGMKSDALNLTMVSVDGRKYSVRLMELWFCKLTGKKEWREVTFKSDHE